MNRIFLSHSSKQKGYVEVIAKKLGKNRIVYDALTFEAGEITLNEIYKGIDASGIFVFFISKESLESTWVTKEILRAEEYINNGRLKKFLPIIIDDSIKHNDQNIPKWIQENYNLKYFSKPTKVFDLIKQALVLVNWDIYPKKREQNQLFIGRTEQIKEFEQRIFDYELPQPSTIVVSGLPSIGRRKFIKHALSNSNNIKINYEPPIIILDNRNSIEDLIVKIYGLGYSELNYEDITNLSSKDIDSKVNLAFVLLEELYKNNDLLFVIDNLSIVQSGGLFVDWYNRLLIKLENIDSPLVCLISRSKLKGYKYLDLKGVFSINIPELEKYERSSLFQALLRLDEMNINKEHNKLLNNLFTGYPEQIGFTTTLIKSEGIDYVIEHPNEIIDFNSEKVSRILRDYHDNKLAVQVLKILSDVEYISINFLKEILAEDFKNIEHILSDFSNAFIIEFIGSSKEFLRLNDSIKDYVQRINYTLNTKYNNNIENHIHNNFEKYESLESDTSEYMISIKESLKRGIDIPNKLLIPSHYLNAMRELYNNEKRYGEVILLADRALNNESYLDLRIVKEIRYWLCLALCRKKNDRLLKEVQYVRGADHNFLLGFYYRLKGRNKDAIEKFNAVLKINSNFYRAKRELVQVYLNTERYDEALELARDNYYLDKNNPYNLQSYYRCLIKTDGLAVKVELMSLLSELEKNPHEKANEMYLTAQAQYLCFIKNDKSGAIRYSDDAINSYNTVIYPYLTKMDILRKFEMYNDMKKLLHQVEQAFDKENEIFNKLSYLTSMALLIAINTSKIEAIEYCGDKIRSNFSKKVYENIVNEIERL